MTIQSYLVYPEPGGITEVQRLLEEMPGCEVMSAENRELLLLVTETATHQEQEGLEKRLYQIPGVECLALVSGWTE
jgi:nitrate reductase NapAB chaperone NapD